MNKKTYNQFILESFDSKPVSWNYVGNNIYEFTIDGNIYNVRLSGSIYDSDYYLTFTLENHPRGDYYGITGTGNEYKVLATVMDCIRDFVQKMKEKGYPVEVIEFDSRNYDYDTNGNRKKLSRTAVYKRLLKKFLPANYRAEIYNDGPKTDFKITRIKSMNESSCINESFNIKPAKWTYNDYQKEYNFSIGEFDYQVFFLEDAYGDEYSYDVRFRLKNLGYHPYGVTGTGNQYLVLVTVIDCIKDFVKRHNDPPIDNLTFSASKREYNWNTDTFRKISRPAVYMRLVKKFMPSGYAVSTKEDSDSVKFTIKKNN